MAKAFYSSSEYKSRKEVVLAAYGAAKIVKVDGGWMVFDTLVDYEVWRKQR